MADNIKPREIYIIGAQSTGKTTIVKALEKHFNQRDDSYQLHGHHISHPKIIKEVARAVLQEHNFTADEIKSSPARSLALQQLILQAQLRAERGISGPDEWFISDRSGADPIVYARKYVGGDAEYELVKSSEWLELRERMSESVVIVCEAGTDWLTDDGVRLMPENKEDWMQFHRHFCCCLDEQGLNYEVLPSKVANLRERVMFVLEKWETANYTKK